MAIPNLRLIDALRKTAKKLQNGNAYQWGNMGSCNCGNLAQELTQYTPEQIHEYALQSRSGDWSEQTAAYCPTSNLPLDWVIEAMLAAGLNTSDLQHLEKLNDTQVLRRLPAAYRYLQHNQRADVVRYMLAWADMLEEELLQTIQIEALDLHPVLV
ncbi:MAG: hypothetical protein MUE85_06225 [Microscillaceae bacterium]|jgi:hypothetical protein|nr:hypothetical protein [Microscillaceae bacterium]